MCVVEFVVAVANVAAVVVVAAFVVVADPWPIFVVAMVVAVVVYMANRGPQCSTVAVATVVAAADHGRLWS